jgi:hypothetical protein
MVKIYQLIDIKIVNREITYSGISLKNEKKVLSQKQDIYSNYPIEKSMKYLTKELILKHFEKLQDDKCTHKNYCKLQKILETMGIL